MTDNNADAENLARGIKAWWRRLAPAVRIGVPVIAALLALGGASYAIGDVRSDVAHHEVRLQAVETAVAAHLAVEAVRDTAAAALARKVDALDSKLDSVKAAQDAQTGMLSILVGRQK